VRLRGPAGTVVTTRAGVELRGRRDRCRAVDGYVVEDAVTALPLTVGVGVPLPW